VPAATNVDIQDASPRSKSSPDIETLPIDNAVAAAWSLLRVHFAQAERWVNVNDL
jgi:hypothetical protein